MMHRCASDTQSMPGHLDRRAFLLGGAGAVLCGCSGVGSPANTGAAPPGTGSGRPPSPSGSTSPTRRGLPEVSRWQASPGEIKPWVKQVAVAEIERRGNRADAALQVVDAQYGGLLTDSASVLVVCRQWRQLPDGAVRAGGSTYDVRVRRSASGWEVAAVRPSRPGQPADSLSRPARRVLSSTHIDFPPASEADLRSGQVRDSVLTALLDLSRSFRMGVSVVRSGHPLYVFGTDRLSDHPQGRAFDVWRIDGRAVVDPTTPRQLVTDFMEAAVAAGSYNVGGPLLPRAAPQFFTDATHHDHVHAGFAA